MTAANQRIEIDGGVLKQQASLGRDSSGAFASAADGVNADLPQWGQQYGAQHGGSPPASTCSRERWSITASSRRASEAVRSDRIARRCENRLHE